MFPLLFGWVSVSRSPVDSRWTGWQHAQEDIHTNINTRIRRKTTHVPKLEADVQFHCPRTLGHHPLAYWVSSCAITIILGKDRTVSTQHLLTVIGQFKHALKPVYGVRV